MCDILVVGVDSDDLVHQVKGPKRPIIPEPQRVAMVDALKPVTAAFVMNSIEDFGRAVKMLSADIIFKNGDFKEDEVVGKEHARVVIIRDLEFPNSTTGIISNIIHTHVDHELNTKEQ